MAVHTSCPKCRAVYHVPDEQLGRKVRCKQCQEAFLVTGDSGGDATAPVVVAAAEPVVVEVAPASLPAPRRLPRRRQQEKKESSGAGGIVVAMLVVFGTLVIIGGAAVFMWYAFIRQPPERIQDYSGPPTKPIGDPGFGPGGPGPAVAEDPELARSANEPAAFEPQQFDQPDSGIRTFFPEAPIRKIVAGDKPEPTLHADGTLDPEVLKRVKAATVFLRVTMADGNIGEGTGFFAVEPGQIVTNAHVLGMLNPASARPARIDVILNSGETDERTLPGQVQVTDRLADLAIVRVTDANLPPPLQVETSKVLRETQPVFVSGFPGGSTRGRNVSITPTHVDSLLKEHGLLDRLQVRSAMLPGNSGGPVVDPRGHVVGVSVAVLLEGVTGNSSVNFAVPSDKVHHLLNGKVSEFTLSYPHQEGDRVKVGLRMKLFDLRQQTRRAAVEWWIGDAGPNRTPANTQPTLLPTDGERTRVPMRREGDELQGELLLGPLPQGKVYWLQPVLFGTREEQTQWFSAVAYQPPPLLANKPALLVRREEAPQTMTDLTTRSTLNMRFQHGQGVDMGVNYEAKLTEQAGSPSGSRQFTTFDIGVRFAGRPVTRGMLRQMIGRRSSLPHPGVEQEQFSKVSMKTRGELSTLSESIQTLIGGLEVPLPGKEVQPQQSWTESRTLSLDHLMDPHATQVFRVTYNYRGTRERGGKAEAIVEFKGRAAEGGNAKGTLEGIAWVDVATGQTTLVRSTLNYDQQTLQGSMNPMLTSVTGKVETRLQRTIK